MGSEVDQAWRWTHVEGMAAQVERLLYGGALGWMGGFAALWLLHGRMGLPFAVVALMAILSCAVLGFFLVEIVFSDDAPSPLTFTGRAALFLALNSVGMGIDWLMMLDLMRRGVGDVLVIAVLGAAVVAVWNYLLNLALTWKL